MRGYKLGRNSVSLSPNLPNLRSYYSCGLKELPKDEILGIGLIQRGYVFGFLVLSL